MKLDDVEGEVFGRLVHWIYYGIIEDYPGPVAWPDIIIQTKIAMAKLWVLARRCLIPKLQNQVMRLLVDHNSRRGLTSSQLAKFINYIEDEDCKELKALMVDTLVWRASSNCFENTFPHLREALKLEVLRLMKQHCSNDNAHKGKLVEERYAVKED
jgi:hypothetical protein